MAPTSRAKSSIALPSSTWSMDITLIATRRCNGGSCSASYTSPNAPEPIQRITRQSPSSTPSSKYLQYWQDTCLSTATGAFSPVVSANATAGACNFEGMEAKPLFSCAFLGFKQCTIARSPRDYQKTTMNFYKIIRYVNLSTTISSQQRTNIVTIIAIRSTVSHIIITCARGCGMWNSSHFAHNILRTDARTSST